MEVKVTTLKDMALGGAELEFDIEVSGPPMMMKVDELEEALQTNRSLLDEYHKGLVADMRKDYIKRAPIWELGYHGLLKNALTSRLAIDRIIPAIIARGGTAQFTPLETKAASLHVEILMKKAEKAILAETAITSIPLSTIIILIFLVCCTVIGYLFLINTSF